MTDNIQEEIEDKIIDCLNSGAEGRLIIFKPEKNISDVDLVVEKKGKYTGREFYLKISGLIEPSPDKKFTVDFKEETFRENENFYLIFVYFNEVTQKISDYLWLVPSIFFRESAQTIKSPNGKKLLRFTGSADFKDKNDYSKFLIKSKEFGNLVLTALEKNRVINIKNPEFEEKRPVNAENLRDFLCEARKNTYAANAVQIDNPKFSGSVQLEFRRGDYFYIDVYFSGEKKIIGQEIIYQELKPVWAMNYTGSQIGVLETNFLKESLLKLSEKCRLWESCEYKKRDLKYSNIGEGSIEEFFGEEKILSGEKNIYKLSYQGGIILHNI